METTNQAQQSKILAGINTLSGDVLGYREKCENIRRLLDEGSYKLEAALNVINGLKTQEKNIASAASDAAVIKQINAEQVDGILEMLKTPAFQSIARQVMLKWVNQEQQHPDK